MEAVVPGVIAPVPEVRVKEPPFLMMSNFDTTLRMFSTYDYQGISILGVVLLPVIAEPQNFTPK